MAPSEKSTRPAGSPQSTSVLGSSGLSHDSLKTPPRTMTGLPSSWAARATISATLTTSTPPAAVIARASRTTLLTLGMYAATPLLVILTVGAGAGAGGGRGGAYG